MNIKQTKKRLKKYALKPIIIEWLDHTTNNGWRKLSNIKDLKSAQVIEVGFLIEDRKNEIVVASAKCIDENDGDWLNVSCIPKKFLKMQKLIK